MSKKIEDFKKEIEAEIKKIWMEEPKELKKIRLGFIDSRAGSYDQYFSTLVFVDGEIRALGYLIYSTLLRMVDDPKYDMYHLRSLARTLVPVCAEFLGYCGLKKIVGFTRTFLDMLEKEEIDNKQDFKDVVRSLTLYANRLHGWVHFYFPWGLGVLFPLRSKIDLKEMESLV